jgi:hypothetical protein
MNMTRQSSKFLAVVLGGLIAATAALAQSSTSSPPSPRAAQDMMGHGGMMGMMEGMSSDHMQQMSRMMDDCNRMMEQRSERATEPGGENTPKTGH